MKQQLTPLLSGLKKPESPHKQAVSRGITRHLAIGGIALFVLVVGLGGMAATIDFSSAVVANGRLVVSGNVKKVQHLEGGTVKTLSVRDGDVVKAGDVLLQLDTTVAGANLAIITKGRDEALARRARLQAERTGAPSISFPDELTSRANQPEVAETMSIEANAFELRLAAREGQKDQLRKKINELEQQLVGVRAQEDAIRRQITLTADEVDGLRTLKNKDLVGTDRMVNAERRAAQLDGELGQLISTAAQIGAEIAQAELQILQIDQDLRSEVSRELAEVGSEINELSERRIAAVDQLSRQEIRAPIGGTVYQLAVHTVGGVVAPGEPLMLIVPEKELLVVEAQITPMEVDRVHPEQEATLRFTSISQRNTPEFDGAVVTVSPDLITDERTGEGYFIARLNLPAEAFDEYSDKLVPGMPVEVFIATGERTVLSYLVKPLGDQIMHTFREN